MGSKLGKLKNNYKDVFQNDVKFSLIFRDFISGNKITNLAFFLNIRVFESFAKKFYISEVHFSLKSA